MINNKVIKYFQDSTYSIVTPYKDISMVFHDNSLSHALLILKESNYKQIPVLNYDKKFIGLISTDKIFKTFSFDDALNFEDLNKLKVADFLDDQAAVSKVDYDFEEILKLLIDANFVSLVNEDGTFAGIITRSSLLKKTNDLLHNIDQIQ